VILQVLNITWMKTKADQREAASLPREFVDYSMSGQFHETGEEIHGENGLQDMTDKENLYFQYLL
jgi:hypothetical protein